MKLTDDELAAMPDKAKRDADVLAIYREHDFAAAYGMHTDKRIAENGYKAAVGSGENWELHGDLQLGFLRAAGLQPSHRLLEIGCGTGRLARKVVPYLMPGRYTGVDLSHGAIQAATTLALDEGWYARHPLLLCGDVPGGQAFDFVWSFSVVIHIPYDMFVDVLRRTAAVMHRESRFYFSYVPETVALRSGVKQFRKTLDQHKAATKAAGLTFADVPDWIRRAGHEPSRATGSQCLALAMLR